MRRVVITGPGGAGGRLRELVEGCGADASWRPQTSDGLDVVVADVPNDAIGALVEALDDAPDVRMSFSTSPVLALEPHVDELLPSVRSVDMLSPTEMVLGGLQSIGSWTGFLLNAFTAGAIVWIAFMQEAQYLLVGAMLIAPLGGPAINGALSIARGELHHLGRAVGRFAAGVLAGATSAALLTLAFPVDVVPALTVDVSTLTRAALVLPVGAGLVGATTLLQSERNSLLSGAATGILVAAALAPPMGMLGIALVVGDWPVFIAAGYLLVLQYVVIAGVGAARFAIAGVGPATHPTERSTRRRRNVAAATAGVAALALVSVQFLVPVEFVRQSIALDVRDEAVRVLRSEGTSLVAVDARFTGQRTDSGQRRVLIEGTVARDDAPAGSEPQVERRLEQRVTDAIESGPLADQVIAHASIELV